MMNFNEFDEKVSKIHQNTEATDPEIEALRRLREHALDFHDSEGRSSQHQVWAWTRLESRMREERHASRWGLWYGLSAALSVVTISGIILFEGMLSSSQGSQTVAAGLKILKSSPTIYATPFHSKEADADVVWATGYRYLPSSYSINE